MPASRAHTRRLQLRPGPDFDLPLVLFSHGWIDLPPYRWDPKTQTMEMSLHLGKALDLRLRAGRGGLTAQLRCAGPVSDRMVARARESLTHMLRLDEDLAGFWSLCRGHRELSWVARRRAGRILRSPTLFEDLMKLLFTTNCSWAATRKMTERLVGSLGRRTPAGHRSFPDPSACAAQGEAFFRDEVRAGYRARACQELAERFADGGFLEDPDLPTPEVRRRLLELRGFGPYAAGQALRLLGHYRDLALDSMCRRKLTEILQRRRPPSDAAIERRYAAFGDYRGLALWMDLTADWHGERQQKGPKILRAQAG